MRGPLVTAALRACLSVSIGLLAQPSYGQGPLRHVAAAPGGRLAASSGYDKRVILWDLETGKKIRQFGEAGRANWLAFHPDGKQLTAAFEAGPDFIRVWDVETGAVVQRPCGHTAEVIWLAWSPDGQRLYSSGCDVTIQVWDRGPGVLLPPFRFPDALCYVRAALSPDGHELTAGDYEGRLWRVDLRRQEVIPLPHSGSKRIWDLAYGPDGRWLAVMGGPQGPRDDPSYYGTLWDRRTGAARYDLSGSDPLAFSPDGRRLVVTCGATNLHVYRLPEE